MTTTVVMQLGDDNLIDRKSSTHFDSGSAMKRGIDMATTVVIELSCRVMRFERCEV